MKDVKSLATLVNSILDDRKADDLVQLDISKKSDFADVMIVASGTSNRHVASLAQHVISGLKATGMQPQVEGLESAEWVLVDAGNMVIHLFQPQARDYYKIDKMWGVASMNEQHAAEHSDELIGE